MQKKIFLFLIVSIFILNSLNAEPVSKPKVAVVLAGGGALGFAHIGALKVLEEEGIQPDLIIGTSMGGIVGALYATGYRAEEIEKIVNDADWKDIMLDSFERKLLSFEQKKQQSRYYLTLDLKENSRITDVGLFQAQKVMEFLDEILSPYSAELDFDDLPIPFRAVSADLLTGEKIVYETGDLKTALRASMSVPGVFTPVYYQERYAIDGGWSENLPATVARDLGADIVIAVALTSLEDDIEKLNSLSAVASQVDQIKSLQQTRESLDAADIVISPDLRGYSMGDFEKGAPLIELGYKGADEQRSVLRALAQTLPESKKLLRVPEERVVSINSITVDTGGNEAHSISIKNYLNENLERRISLSSLRETVYSLYDSGDYSYVWYRLIPDDSGSYELHVEAPGIDHSRFEFSASLDFGSQVIDSHFTEFTLKTAIQYWLGEKKYSQLFAELWLSDFPSFILGASIKPGRKSWQTGAALSYVTTSRYYFQDDVVSSTNAIQDLSGTLFMAIPLFRVSEIGFENYYGYTWSNNRSGVPVMDDQGWFNMGFREMLSIDSLDRIIAPRKGVNAALIFDNSFDSKLQMDLTYKTAGRGYIPLFSERFILIPQWEAQGLIKGNLPVIEEPVLGRAINLYGFYPQELSGENVAMGGIEARFRLGTLPLGAGQEFYLILGGQFAATWQDDIPGLYDHPELYGGYGFGFILNTTIGEVQMNATFNQDGRFSSFLGISTSSSLLDKLQ